MLFQRGTIDTDLDDVFSLDVSGTFSHRHDLQSEGIITKEKIQLHYILMSEMATCVSVWVLPFYANAHLVYVVCSNSPFWFLLALIFERLAALMGWRNYEASGPVLSIFLVLIAVYSVKKLENSFVDEWSSSPHNLSVFWQRNNWNQR